MAPDLNSISSFPPRGPSSRRASTNSRRPSNQMPTPSLPLASPTMTNILPSNQQAVVQGNSTSTTTSSPSSSFATTGDQQGNANLGPLRHPRPITAADLHMELEKEQEAVVNRLTRELSILRASQNASVASNASSTSISSASHLESNEMTTLPQHSASSNPVPPRRHQRSGSSTSIRSISGASVTNENIAGVAPERPRSIMHRHDSNTYASPHISSHDRASVSRQNSSNSTTNRPMPHPRTTSGTSSPDYVYNPPGYIFTPPTLPAQLSRERSSSSVLNQEERHASTSIPATTRLDEIMHHKQELDNAKRENEALKARIRELESLVSQTRRVSRNPPVCS